MTPLPVFLSVVYVVHNQGKHLADILANTSKQLLSLVSDYELIIVDNASSDESLSVLKGMTGEKGLPNLQVYALTKTVSIDTASWVGLENALGDFIAVLNPFTDDVSFLGQMLNKALSGTDVVFANNQQKPKQTLAYRLACAMFNGLYQSCSGINLSKEAPQYRLLSKRVVHFIMQHAQPVLAYRYLPATSGFARANMEYSSKPLISNPKKLGESIERGIQLLVSTTRVPMRLVTILSLFGACANLLYSVYVVAVGFFKMNVAPGWISLSLQQSGMFFLISLVLLVLGEYILNMASLSNEGPLYHIGQEFTSTHMTRREKLNIEEVFPTPMDIPYDGAGSITE